MTIGEAYSKIEDCHGFDDSTSVVGEAWERVKVEIATLHSQLAASQDGSNQDNAGIPPDLNRNSATRRSHVGGFMDRAKIAKIAHEINRAYCNAIGDHSQVSWEEAPEWQRRSAMVGVAFHLENPEAQPSASHESWLAEKEREGWKYGIIKDVENKEHPCFLPYCELPAEQRAKDYLFKAVCEQLRGEL